MGVSRKVEVVRRRQEKGNGSGEMECAEGPISMMTPAWNFLFLT